MPSQNSLYTKKKNQQPTDADTQPGHAKHTTSESSSKQFEDFIIRQELESFKRAVSNNQGNATVDDGVNQSVHDNDVHNDNLPYVARVNVKKVIIQLRNMKRVHVSANTTKAFIEEILEGGESEIKNGAQEGDVNRSDTNFSESIGGESNLPEGCEYEVKK